MSSTEEKRVWIARALNIDVQGHEQEQDLVVLAAFKMEAQTLRSSHRAFVKDFSTISTLLNRVSTMVQDAAVIASLSKLSELSTGASGSSAGEEQRAIMKDFVSIGGLFQKASAAAITAAPGDSLSLLAQLGAGTPAGSTIEPRALLSDLREIQGHLEKLSESTGELNTVSALLAFSELQSVS